MDQYLNKIPLEQLKNLRKIFATKNRYNATRQDLAIIHEWVAIAYLYKSDNLNLIAIVDKILENPKPEILSETNPDSERQAIAGSSF